MPEYVYRAITKEGVIVRNRVESPSKQNLIKRLKGWKSSQKKRN